MRRGACAVLFAGALWPCAYAAEDIGWYTAPADAQSARSYWIAGPQGLVILGTQLLPAETDAMVHEAQSRTGRKVLMALVLAPTPAQFNGTAVLQKRGVKVYTSQQLPAAPEALARVKQKMLEAYPVYASPDNLAAIVKMEWQRQAGGAAH